jgi:UDP-N-acetylmuramoyl-L-alanyl-D-glutamate--2,6-diaminopimelate ligase
LVSLFSRMKANGVTHCVMEVSSHALDQQRVAGIDWAVAIFTNLTGDHLDYHGTMEEYAKAKAKLFRGLKEGAVAVVNVNDAWVKHMVEKCRAKVVGYGFRTDPMVSLGKGVWTGRTVGWSIGKMELEVMGPAGGWRSLNSPLVGKHNAYNLLSVIGAADALAIDDRTIFKTLLQAPGAPGRLQRVRIEATAPPFEVFVDYAHTHDALASVLAALTPVPSPGRMICLFGCGGDRDRTKRPKMARAAEMLSNVVIVSSDNPRTENPIAIIEEICAGFSPGWRDSGKIFVEPDRRAAIGMAIGMAQPGDVVLLAGKGHENYQIIGTTKYHFDDVEEAEAALRDKLATNQQ